MLKRFRIISSFRISQFFFPIDPNLNIGPIVDFIWSNGWNTINNKNNSNAAKI